ncbi:uncharacterized protein LOC117815586 [Notolabrus celidotus]|uniref:uncharacterized protein LOC117815586 n=1 Tax=Notolabrus celidotus TaxID=1203425 RepID=UPI00148FCC80|nr:uncharacterized protein LOC117815586 [Notolabrus celidotus]
MPTSKVLLLDTLEDLMEDDFKKLKWYLSNKFSDSWKPIAQSHLESASRIVTVDKIVSCYGEDPAVSLTVEVLTRMGKNEEARHLQSAYKGGKTAAASPSSTAAAAPAPVGPTASAAPAAPLTITATNGGVTFSPIIQGSNPGTWNVNIHQKSEMQAAPLILDTLDELGADEFKRFRWNLSQPVLNGCQPIRKGLLESADRQDTVGKMIDSYGEEAAVNLAVDILKRMNHNNTAEKLRRAFSGGSTAVQAPPPLTCYPAGSIFVAPNIQGTSAGTINMNINTK